MDFQKKLRCGLLLVALVVASLFFVGETASAVGGASLYASPAQGTFSVGDTFTVSIFVNSGGSSINAVEANLRFPPDKIQIVSPSTGKSFIDVWVGQPTYSNKLGTISFRGTIPSPGINVSQGLISTVTFRVKSTGKAVISFEDDSKVLLNDGKATNILSQTSGAIYDLSLPPPGGPIVVSKTHPDQSSWYPNDTAVFSWAGGESVDGYSYVLNSEPISVPDNVPDSDKNDVSYTDLSDGIHYFHIKAHEDGIWGGVTHYVLNIDANPPADFDLTIDPRKTTTQRKPIIQFATTDGTSGAEHYEIKVIPLYVFEGKQPDSQSQEFFVEATSPYIPELDPGKYDVVVRAYDRAGNFQETKDRLVIVSSFWKWLGLTAFSSFWVLILLFLIAAFSAYVARHYKKWHTKIDTHKKRSVVEHKGVQEKLATLKKYQKKYGHLLAVFALAVSFIVSFNVALANDGGERLSLPPPIVTTISEEIANNEIFYIAGKESVINSQITIFLQNETTGEAISFTARTDDKGDWFYSHRGFLPVGDYLIWAQARIDEVVSAPSAQFKLEVVPTAIQIGASRLSYGTVYFGLSVIFLIIILIFTGISIYHFYHGKKKEKVLLKEINEAQESVKRGFAILRKDIQKELDVIERAKLKGELKKEEEEREKTLLEDLQLVEQSIGKEVWDIRAAL